MRRKVGQLKLALPSFFHIHPTFIIFTILLLLFVLFEEIQGIRHSEGLNRWSFLSPNEQHDLYSDLLCPNPMLGGSESRIISSNSKYSSSNNNLSASTIIRGYGENPIPNDIWALKTSNEITFLPCDLKQYTSLLHNNKPLSPYSNSEQMGGLSNNNFNNATVQNRILFMNLSFQPFDFGTAKLCNKFIKLQFDDEEGVELTCDENPLGSEMGVNHIYWPNSNTQKQRKAFSIFRNLERFLQNEEKLQRKFYFQIYFTSANGRVKKCTVQQYELNLSNPGCNPRRRPRIEDVCGEFNCEDHIFPYYQEKRVKFIWKSDGSQPNHGKPTIYYPEYENSDKNTNRTSGRYFFNYRRFDVRFVVFITVLPIVLFGMLIFGLEIIIYITCLRRSRNATDGARDARSQQILQNSLNLWESIPNREARTVSFSPVTTNIDLDGSESPLPDPQHTPRVLKSALKKSIENLPPPPASFFEMERECPPTYVEAMNH